MNKVVKDALNKMGMVSEILVDLSKSHITTNEAIRQIKKCNVGNNYSIVRKELSKLDKIKKVVEPYSKGNKYEFYQLPIDLADILLSIIKGENNE